MPDRLSPDGPGLRGLLRQRRTALTPCLATEAPAAR
jgi:hypothetical protein